MKKKQTKKNISDCSDCSEHLRKSIRATHEGKKMREGRVFFSSCTQKKSQNVEEHTLKYNVKKKRKKSNYNVENKVEI